MAQSGLQFESYLKAIGKTPEELREDRRESAENRVTTSLISESGWQRWRK